jgi:hypothetical protein
MISLPYDPGELHRHRRNRETKHNRRIDTVASWHQFNQ